MKITKIDNVQEIALLRYKMFQEIGTIHLLVENFVEKTEKEYSLKIQEGKMIHLGVMENDIIVSIAGGYIASDFPTYYFKESYTGYIMDVYTDPDYRKRGYAKQLVEELHYWFLGKDIKTIKLDSSKFGRSLYKKIGYESSIEMSIRLDQ